MPENMYGRPRLNVAIAPPIRGPMTLAMEPKDCDAPRTIPCSSGVDSREISDCTTCFESQN